VLTAAKTLSLQARENPSGRGSYLRSRSGRRWLDSLLILALLRYVRPYKWPIYAWDPASPPARVYEAAKRIIRHVRPHAAERCHGARPTEHHELAA
jgi:hypothetical protein